MTNLRQRGWQAATTCTYNLCLQRK